MLRIGPEKGRTTTTRRTTTRSNLPSWNLTHGGADLVLYLHLLGLRTWRSRSLWNETKREKNKQENVTPLKATGSEPYCRMESKSCPLRAPHLPPPKPLRSTALHLAGKYTKVNGGSETGAGPVKVTWKKLVSPLFRHLSFLSSSSPSLS